MHSSELGNFIAEVTDKVRAGQQALVDIGRRRTLLAFDAHRGGKKAKVELAELAARIPVIEAELSDLEAARAEARRRLDEALAKETRERRISDVRETLKVIEKAKDVASAVDAAADSLASAAKAFDAAIEEIRKIGVTTEFPGIRAADALPGAIQAAFPYQCVLRGFSGEGTRCIEVAKRLGIPGNDLRLLHEATERGE